MNKPGVSADSFLPIEVEEWGAGDYIYRRPQDKRNHLLKGI